MIPLRLVGSGHVLLFDDFTLIEGTSVLFHRTCRYFGLILVVGLLQATTVRAGALWYNGDADNVDSLINEKNVPINTSPGYVIQNALVYQNFVVPDGQTWTITSVYSNNALAYSAAVLTATWEIRSGVSAGIGGKLEANGDTTATQTAIGTIGNLTEYQISASVPSVVLTAGEYWLAVVPDSQGYYGDQSYVATTSGASAVGLQASDSGNTYLSYTYPTPTNFVSAADFMGNSTPENFSMGIEGTFTMVPEPSSLVLSLVGFAGSACLLRRRSHRRTV